MIFDLRPIKPIYLQSKKTYRWYLEISISRFSKRDFRIKTKSIR